MAPLNYLLSYMIALFLSIAFTNCAMGSQSVPCLSNFTSCLLWNLKDHPT